ncbi:MAG: hypothetical protein AB7K09_21155 [Planctomycetota bacterium]
MTSRAASVVLWLIVVASQAATTARAQDHQYWTNQYGPRSTMLGGAAVAGAGDTSGIIYNPGGLGYNDGGGIDVNANAWRIGHIILRDGAGSGGHLEVSPITQVPLLLAGVVRIDEWPETRLALALTARSLFSFAASSRITQNVDVIASEAGIESYTGQYTFATNLNEIHLAGAVGHRVSRTVSFGLSMFGALRTQSTTETISVGAIAPSSSVSSYVDNRNVSLVHVRLIFKLGMEIEPVENLRIGGAITSPGLGLIGSGSLSREITVNHVDLDTDGTADDAFGSALQSGLPVQWNSPFSISAGAAWTADANIHLMLAMELFLPIDRYTTIAPTAGTFEQSATGLLPALDTAMRTTAAAGWVFNVGIGAEFVFEPYRPDTDPRGSQTGFTLRVGFRTDFTSARDDAGATFEQGIASWDLFHFTIGLAVENRSNEFTVGFEFTIPGGTYRQHVTFDNPVEANFMLGTPGRTPVGYLVIGLVIGYSRNF